MKNKRRSLPHALEISQSGTTSSHRHPPFSFEMENEEIPELVDALEM